MVWKPFNFGLTPPQGDGSLRIGDPGWPVQPTPQPATGHVPPGGGHGMGQPQRQVQGPGTEFLNFPDPNQYHTMAFQDYYNKYTGETGQVNQGGFSFKPGDHGWVMGRRPDDFSPEQRPGQGPPLPPPGPFDPANPQPPGNYPNADDATFRPPPGDPPWWPGGGQPGGGQKTDVGPNYAPDWVDESPGQLKLMYMVDWINDITGERKQVTSGYGPPVGSEGWRPFRQGGGQQPIGPGGPQQPGGQQQQVPFNQVRERENRPFEGDPWAQFSPNDPMAGGPPMRFGPDTAAHARDRHAWANQVREAGFQPNVEGVWSMDNNMTIGPGFGDPSPPTYSYKDQITSWAGPGGQTYQPGQVPWQQYGMGAQPDLWDEKYANLEMRRAVGNWREERGLPPIEDGNWPGQQQPGGGMAQPIWGGPGPAPDDPYFDVPNANQPLPLLPPGHPAGGTPQPPASPGPDNWGPDNIAEGFGGRWGSDPQGMFTRDWVDSDGDRTDDRHQFGPGMPRFTTKDWQAHYDSLTGEPPRPRPGTGDWISPDHPTMRPPGFPRPPDTPQEQSPIIDFAPGTPQEYIDWVVGGGLSPRPDQRPPAAPQPPASPPVPEGENPWANEGWRNWQFEFNEPLKQWLSTQRGGAGPMKQALISGAVPERMWGQFMSDSGGMPTTVSPTHDGQDREVSIDGRPVPPVPPHLRPPEGVSTAPRPPGGGYTAPGRPDWATDPKTSNPADVEHHRQDSFQDWWSEYGRQLSFGGKPVPSHVVNEHIEGKKYPAGYGSPNPQRGHGLVDRGREQLMRDIYDADKGAYNAAQTTNPQAKYYHQSSLLQLKRALALIDMGKYPPEGKPGLNFESNQESSQRANDPSRRPGMQPQAGPPGMPARIRRQMAQQQRAAARRRGSRSFLRGM